MFNLSTEALDIIARAFLLLSQEYTIVLFMSVGFLILNRPIFGRALFILLFSMILNTLLKSIWQIPLPENIGPGFAFPSGHMQAAVVLWGWLSSEFRNRRFVVLSLILLTGIAFGLLHFGYHTSIDIIGAIFFGSVLLILYHYFLKITWLKQHNPQIGCLFAMLSVPILLLLPNYPAAIWTAEGALLGFSLGWSYQAKYQPHLSFIPKTFQEKTMLILLTVLGIFAITFCCHYLLYDYSKPLNLLLSTFFLGLWISVGALGARHRINNLG